MKIYNAKNIRNIAIAGHGGRGKTTLAEAMLFLSKASDRMGKVADGNTVMDFDAEEKKRKVSLSMVYTMVNTLHNKPVAFLSVKARMLCQVKVITLMEFKQV